MSQFWCVCIQMSKLWIWTCQRNLLCSLGSPQTFALLSLPLPHASNLPEKLIVCHIASVLRRTLMHGGGSSRRNLPIRPLKRVFGCSFGHQTWLAHTLSHLDVLQPFRVVFSRRDTWDRFPFHCDSSQWDNAATLFLSTPNKVTQMLSVLSET